jgi:hypothetical protein
MDYVLTWIRNGCRSPLRVLQPLSVLKFDSTINIGYLRCGLEVCFRHLCGCGIADMVDRVSAMERQDPLELYFSSKTKQSFTRSLLC